MNLLYKLKTGCVSEKCGKMAKKPPEILENHKINVSLWLE